MKRYRLSASGTGRAPFVSAHGLEAGWRENIERQGMRVLSLVVVPPTVIAGILGLDILAWPYTASIVVDAPETWAPDAVRLAVQTAGSDALGWFGGPAPVVTIPGIGEPTQEAPTADPSGLGAVLGEAKTLLMVAVVGIAVVAVAVGFGPGLRR